MFAPLESRSDYATVPTKGIIKIGDATHTIGLDIDPSMIPFIASLLRLETKIQPSRREFVLEPVPHFEEALKGIKVGYHYGFCLDFDIPQHKALCETYRFLGVGVFGDQPFRETINEIWTGIPWDGPKYKIFAELADKRLKKQCDAAYKLVYLMLLGEPEDLMRHKGMIFSAVQYIIVRGLQAA
ncbi:hypothetical protein MMC10_008143 [Thelotrema lepadinum]|nr:hypothetical protein [Thelotrema lepadinum]